MTTKYKLVPIEPTEEMLIAITNSKSPWNIIDAYKAMLEAAPAQDSEPVAWRQTIIESSPMQGTQSIIHRYTGFQVMISDEPLYLHQPADKADAERYRWIRDNDLTLEYSEWIYSRLNPTTEYLHGKNLDEAIDKARSES